MPTDNDDALQNVWNTYNHYSKLGHALRDTAEIQALKKAVVGVMDVSMHNEGKSEIPFIFVEGSSGLGKT